MSPGLYIHIPFCRSKCLFCDFYAAGIRVADWDLYNSCLINELKVRACELNDLPDTLYIGGGTPSLIPPDLFITLIDNIKNILNHPGNWKEFTLEVNPEDVCERNIEAWLHAGVNRVSLGIQSFSNEELRQLRRNHSVEEAISAYNLLDRYFPNMSIDLMFGIPGQTMESWDKTVNTAIGLRPRHLSAYCLMLEEGTPLTLLNKQNKIFLPDDNITMQMWDGLMHSLNEAGFIHYEISNYSKPGFQSIHNTKYWENIPYLGLGPGAHSYDGINRRRFNKKDLKGYLRHFTSFNDVPFYDQELLSAYEMEEEYIMTRLRLMKGFDLKEFLELFGKEKHDKLNVKIQKLINRDLLKKIDDNVSLTQKGVKISDAVIIDLF